MRIIVLAKQVPDTRNVGKDAMKEDGTINRGALPAIFNPEDLNALEQALRIKDKFPGTTITMLTMGPGRAAEIIREGMFRGADNGYLLTDRSFAGADTLATSYALSMAIRKIGDFDLIIGDEGREYTVVGQSKVAVAPGTVTDVRLHPEAPAVPRQVPEAISEAEWVVLGPGSWFTSVIPHLLVPDIHRALVTTDAHRALILNLSRQRGETDKMTTADHVRVLHQYAPDFKLDVVIADPTATDDIDDLIVASEAVGARVLLRQVRTGDGQPHHDPLRLAAALRDAFDGFLGEVGKTEAWL